MERDKLWPRAEEEDVEKRPSTKTPDHYDTLNRETEEQEDLVMMAKASGKCLGCFIRRGMFALCGEIKHHLGRFSFSHGFPFPHRKKTT
jgi:hypothetical protein